jgi:hypothetical protein
MYDMPNHKERRRIAKQLGLLKKRASLPFKQRMEEVSRAIAAGKEMHRQKTENLMRSLEEQEIERESGPTEAKKVNPKREIILGKVSEKRSYNEAAADLELHLWNNRFNPANSL